MCVFLSVVDGVWERSWEEGVAGVVVVVRDEGGEMECLV